MKRFTMLFAVLTLMVSTAFAQNGAFAPYVSGSVSTSANLGYKNPDFTVGAGIESSTKNLLLDVHGTFDTANSIKTDNGYAGTLTGAAYYKFFGHILGGAGANWSVNTAQLKTQFANIDATRQSAHTFIGGGVQFGKVRILANYNLPGKDALLNERIIDVNTEIFLKKHLRLTQNTTLNSYVGAGNVRATASKIGVGLKLVI
jgi:hypothetical protein